MLQLDVRIPADVVNAGTLTIDYPSGFSSASFASSGHYANYDSAGALGPSTYSSVFGASSITVQNNTGSTWVAQKLIRFVFAEASTDGGLGVTIDNLPAATSVAGADLEIVQQSGTTKQAAKSLSAGLVPTQEVTATAIPLNKSGGHMDSRTMSGTLTLTVGTAVDGGSCMVRIIGDGTNTPNVSAFIKVGEGSYVATNAVVNVFQFFYLDGVAYYSVAQAA